VINVQSDLLDVHSIKRYWKDIENGHGQYWKMQRKRSWKVTENRCHSVCSLYM